MAKQRGEKAKRVATTNIKVTVPTLQELRVATDMLGGKTQSEVISMALRALLPNLLDEISRREEINRIAAQRTENLNQN